MNAAALGISTLCLAITGTMPNGTISADQVFTEGDTTAGPSVLAGHGRPLDRFGTAVSSLFKHMQSELARFDLHLIGQWVVVSREYSANGRVFESHGKVSPRLFWMFYNLHQICEDFVLRPSLRVRSSSTGTV